MVLSNDEQRLQGERHLEVPNNSLSQLDTHEHIDQQVQHVGNRTHSTGYERQNFNESIAFLPPTPSSNQNPPLQSGQLQLQSPVLQQSATFPAHFTPVFAPSNTSHAPQEHQHLYHFHQSATEPLHQNNIGQQTALPPPPHPEPPLFTITSSTYYLPPSGVVYTAPQAPHHMVQMNHQNATFPNAQFPQFNPYLQAFPVHTAQLAPLYDAYLQAQYASKQPRQDDHWMAGRNSSHQQLNNQFGNQHQNHDGSNSSSMYHSGNGNGDGYGNAYDNCNGISVGNSHNYGSNNNHYRKSTWNNNSSYSTDQPVASNAANNQSTAGNTNNTRASAATSGNEPSAEHQAGKHVYIVQFKQFCKEYLLGYRAPDTIKVGDMVVVAADRGEDMGEVVEILPLAEFYKNRDKFNNNQSNNSNIHNSSGFVRVVSTNSMGSFSSFNNNSGGVSPSAAATTSTGALQNTLNSISRGSSVDTYDTLNSWPGAVAVYNSIMSPAVGANSEYVRPLGRLLRLATEQELAMLHKKSRDELKVISYAQNLIATVYHFNMQIMDAEYQFDRLKLTVFYATIDNARIDFRDFVKTMYSVYKVRIWMERL